MIKEDYNIITFDWNSINQKNQETEWNVMCVYYKKEIAFSTEKQFLKTNLKSTHHNMHTQVGIAILK